MKRWKLAVLLALLPVLLAGCSGDGAAPKTLEAGEDGFVFTAEKWRSGLGAIWFTDCAAVRGSGGQWSYQPGGFSIA